MLLNWGAIHLTFLSSLSNTFVMLVILPVSIVNFYSICNYILHLVSFLINLNKWILMIY